jgi:hypothetical protein
MIFLPAGGFVVSGGSVPTEVGFAVYSARNAAAALPPGVAGAAGPPVDDPEVDEPEVDELEVDELEVDELEVDEPEEQAARSVTSAHAVATKKRWAGLGIGADLPMYE